MFCSKRDDINIGLNANFFCMPEPPGCIGPCFGLHMLALNRVVNALPLFGITDPSTVETQRAS